MKNQIVAARLRKITPRRILHLINDNVAAVIMIPMTNTRGILSHYVIPGKMKWVITIDQLVGQHERLLILLHELFHIVLFEDGLDGVMERQNYSDKLLNDAAHKFIRKFPNFTLHLSRAISIR